MVVIVDLSHNDAQSFEGIIKPPGICRCIYERRPYGLSLRVSEDKSVGGKCQEDGKTNSKGIQN